MTIICSLCVKIRHLMQYSNVYQFCYIINELFIATERINYYRTREMFLHKYLIGKVLFLLNVWKVSGPINIYVLGFF